jgi:small subunit ribosomal protein S1
MEGASDDIDPKPGPAPGESDTSETGAEVEAEAMTPSPEGHAGETPEPQGDDQGKDTGRPGAEAKSPKKKWRREPGLALSFRKGLPVEGRVESVIRGGYEIRVGRARGFCPHSQMDVKHIDRPEEHIGRTYQFKAVQLRRGGEEVILSRRALLEEERSEEAKAVRATLVEGSIMQGHVARITDFGAFVDLGAGVTGLVHVSEATHARVPSLSDVLKPGETVQVRILKLDESTGRISLSIRQAKEDPWKSVPGRFPTGSVHRGTIRRTAEFGVFVEMEPGLEALAAADAFPPGPEGWQEGLSPGVEREWTIVSVEPDRHRMSVHPVLDPESQSGAASIELGAKLRGRVQKVEKFGVFVWLGPGRVGLLPNVNTGTRRGTDLTKAFPPGKEIEVEVLETDPDGRRVRLSIPGAQAPKPAPARLETPHRKEREKSAARPKPAEPTPHTASPGFGTSLGDALREAFKKSAGES